MMTISQHNMKKKRKPRVENGTVEAETIDKRVANGLSQLVKKGKIFRYKDGHKYIYMLPPKKS